MCLLEQFIKELMLFLTENSMNNNLIRTHNKKLDQLGDLSFPAEIKSWKRVLGNILESGSEDIINYLRKQSILEIIDELVNDSQSWTLLVSKCLRIKNNYHIYFDRAIACKLSISEVLQHGVKYGSSDITLQNNLIFKLEATTNDQSIMNISQLRLVYVKETTENLLTFMNCASTNLDNVMIQFTLTSNAKSNNKEKIVFCGPVLSDVGMKKSATTAEDYIKKRTIDMRLIAEHKYGLRITTQPGWQEFFEKLGEAASVIELLQNKPSHSTTISMVDSSLTSIKGPSFILYNCARLSKLHKEFDKLVAQKTYPPLPDLKDIDCGLLKEPEEWELLYVYVLQYPNTIKSCIFDIENGKVNCHNLVNMLSNLCNIFSIYYRRIRILTAPREHMYPVIFARIYLLKSVEQVLHNTLKLLNIEPVKQM